MTRRLRSRARGEEGSALVMALLFLSVCAVTIGGLLSFANTSARSTTTLRVARGYDYDAQGAMDAAIATVRLNTAPLCTLAGATVFTPAVGTLNYGSTRPLRVDCYSQAGSPSGQRNDVLSVCPTSASTPCPDNVSLLRASVIFYDTPSTGASLAIQTWSNQ